jgi:hypothetical protein
VIAGAGARCERELGRTTNESEPSARGEPPSLGRRQPGVSRMRPDVVVIEPPALEQLSGVGEVLEYLLVQELVAKPADEALDESVLLRLARHDVVPVEAGAVGPRQDSARGQLRTIIADDRRRRTMPGNEPIELARHAYPGDRRVGDRCQALASEVVDHDQDPEAPGGKAVRDEVERPALIRRPRQGQ